ncbi:Gfo/Idh/MocA family protein [Pleomorphochaeta sp. DL1XJH-081]|uniref:Gfo/Idh/MocA family protein n=1 Tax=Pleomorphochaeta sp. DL1XJH-081 TaxID=3409690 RepID=UPI003BB5AE54
MKIRVGVVGAGIYGSVLINAYYGAHRRGDIEFVAVADISSDALAKIDKKYGIKGYLDYKEMYEKEHLDAVAIVTPDFLHEACVIDAANSGIHILVQKPLSTDIGAAERMIKAAKDNDVMLYVDFHKRFDPGHMHLRKAVKDKKLGEIEYGYVCMEDKILVPTEWFKSWAHNSSPVWFLGVHFFDLIYWILEEKPVRVYATGHKKKLASLGIDSYDSIQAKFEFPSGATVSIDSSWIIPNSFSSVVNQQIRLVGTDGMQEVDSQDRGVVAVFGSDDYSHVINPYGQLQVDDIDAGSVPTGYTIESMLYFLRLVNKMKRDNLTPITLQADYPTGDQALVSTIMCSKVHESVEKGKVLEITY